MNGHVAFCGPVSKRWPERWLDRDVLHQSAITSSVAITKSVHDAAIAAKNAGRADGIRCQFSGSGLTAPSPDCWEVEAGAGVSSLCGSSTATSGLYKKGSSLSLSTHVTPSPNSLPVVPCVAIRLEMDPFSTIDVTHNPQTHGRVTTCLLRFQFPDRKPRAPRLL